MSNINWQKAVYSMCPVYVAKANFIGVIFMAKSRFLFFIKAFFVASLVGMCVVTAKAQTVPGGSLDYKNIHSSVGGLTLPSDEQILSHIDALGLPTDHEIDKQRSLHLESHKRSFDEYEKNEKSTSALKPFREGASADERNLYRSGLAEAQGQFVNKVERSVRGGSTGMMSAEQGDRLQELLKQHEEVKRTLNMREESGTYSVPEDALLVFVSFSMPQQVLENLAQQARLAGGVMVLRGMVNGNLSETQAAAARVNSAGAAWEINPELFTTFDVQTVPAFVLTGDKTVLDAGCAPNDFEQCSNTNTFSKVSGDLSVQVALDTMRMRSEIPLIRTMAQTRLTVFDQ